MGFRIPRRNPMPPPNLTTDAPVLNVFDPLLVDFFPVLRIETNEMSFHHRERFVGLGIF